MYDQFFHNRPKWIGINSCKSDVLTAGKYLHSVKLTNPVLNNTAMSIGTPKRGLDGNPGMN